MKNLRHCLFVFGIIPGMSLWADAQHSNSLSDAQSYPSSSQNEYAASDVQQNYSTTAKSTNSVNGSSTQALRFGIVNTKKCLEDSKLGKQEQSNFEKMKQQMRSILEDKEKILEDIESKLNDDDYMDSISEDAASELKRKRRSVRNEGMQLQSQYMETLQQANLKVIQKLTEAIGKASNLVSQDSTNNQPIDVIFTDEACTYYSPRLDVTDRVVAKMNTIFDTEQKENASKSR